jgi:hypothetical protein
MRSTSIVFIAVAAFPIIACQVDAAFRPPQYSAQVEVNAPPPPQIQVDVTPPPDPNAQVQVDATTQVDPNAQTTDTDASAVSDFRNVLAPYGTWVDDPTYGTIWQPNPSVVGADFTPYGTAGHWVYDSDYTWVSDYDWGWAPFHYGRWVSLPQGWSWIPGKEYAGAWVTWRNGDDGYGFVGWAPTAPTYYWRGGVAVNLATPWFQPRFNYVESNNLFVAGGLRGSIIRDPVRIRGFEAHTRVFAPSGSVVVGGNTRMTVRGPAPTHLGLNVATLPRPPANNPGLAHAQAFSHQHTQPVGNTMGTHVNQTHPPIEQQHGTTGAVTHPVEPHATAEVHASGQANAPEMHGAVSGNVDAHATTPQPVQPQQHTTVAAPSASKKPVQPTQQQTHSSGSHSH